MAYIIRDFGEWALASREKNCNAKFFLNKTSGEMRADPPDEVLEMLTIENAKKRLPVYDATSNNFTPLRCPTFENVIVQEQILDCYGDNAMILRNMLTPAECKAIIAQAESFGLEDCGYSPTMRITDRVSVMGGDLGKLLFERAQPFLPPIEVRSTSSGIQPVGVRPDMTKGTWIPTSLNPCFRVCRYAPGGFFQPHHDGGFDYDREHRSIKTFMLYLNDGFEGGPTTFYKESQDHYSDPDRSMALYDFQPELGSCLAFNHCICHDGGRLKTGQKYLLRTEVMYQLLPKERAPCEAPRAMSNKAATFQFMDDGHFVTLTRADRSVTVHVSGVGNVGEFVRFDKSTCIFVAEEGQGTVPGDSVDDLLAFLAFLDAADS